MLEGAETRLRLSQTATGLRAAAVAGGVQVLRAGLVRRRSPTSSGAFTTSAIDPSRDVAIVVAAVVTSFAIGGVPSGAAVVVAPVLAAAGLPVEAMGVLLAVDPIPNAFRTVANVTGMLAVAVLGTLRRRPERPCRQSGARRRLGWRNAMTTARLTATARTARLLVALTMVVVLACVLASLVQTSGGRVGARTSRSRRRTGSGSSRTCSSRCRHDRGVPGAARVVVVPGFQRSKEALRTSPIELARRGMVVISIDPYAQGSSSSSVSNQAATTEGYGMFAVVDYVANTGNLNYVDKSRLGRHRPLCRRECRDSRGRLLRQAGSEVREAHASSRPSSSPGTCSASRTTC